MKKFMKFVGIAALLADIIPMNDLSGSNFFRLDVQDNLRSYYETKFHVSIIEPYQRTVVASSEGEVNVCYRIWTYGNFSADRLRDARMENILRFRYKDSAPTIEEEKNSDR